MPSAYSREPVVCTRIMDDALPEAIAEFSWHYGEDDRIARIYIMLPCGHRAGLPVAIVGAQTSGWSWDGFDKEFPTLKPSIYCRSNDRSDCWHGFMTKGVLQHV